MFLQSARHGSWYSLPNPSEFCDFIPLCLICTSCNGACSATLIWNGEPWSTTNLYGILYTSYPSTREFLSSVSRDMLVTEQAEGMLVAWLTIWRTGFLSWSMMLMKTLKFNLAFSSPLSFRVSLKYFISFYMIHIPHLCPQVSSGSHELLYFCKQSWKACTAS